MKKNMGNIDRSLRVLIAAVLAILYFTETISGTFGLVLLVVAVILLLTSILGICPMYYPLGMQTNGKSK